MHESSEIDELIVDIAHGDRVAFRALYELTAPKLFGCAMRILKDAQKSADAMQDAYLQIWRYAVRFDALKGTGEAWMIGILRFRAIDITRRDRARSEYFQEYEIDENETLKVLERVDNMPETTIALRECLERISEDQRRALLEIHLYGFTGEEYADLNQIPLGTIKSRVRRGLKNLRNCMEQ